MCRSSLTAIVDLDSLTVALTEASRIGYPVMLKAAAGGGGRGMRVIRSEEEMSKAFFEARNEARTAFGDDKVFLEKFIEDPKHIEVQILGDNYGNIVHLHERDCSVQRRFQKVVEVAPSTLPQEIKSKIHEYAMRIARHVNYNNAGTAEFLVDRHHNIYFIEVNPRIQVEHTITEEITGIDIVRSQILIAAGVELSAPSIFINRRMTSRSMALQCSAGLLPRILPTTSSQIMAPSWPIEMPVALAYVWTKAHPIRVRRFRLSLIPCW